MAGIVGVKYKVMPTSPEVDLEEIKENAKKIVESHGGNNKEYAEEPIAFGLKAVIVFFHYDEESELDKIEEELEKIENVNSVQLIDIRKIA
jgi:elongation factor 1-beta